MHWLPASALPLKCTHKEPFYRQNAKDTVHRRVQGRGQLCVLIKLNTILLLSAPECTMRASSEVRSDNPHGAAGKAA